MIFSIGLTYEFMRISLDSETMEMQARACRLPHCTNSQSSATNLSRLLAFAELNQLWEITTGLNRVAAGFLGMDRALCGGSGGSTVLAYLKSYFMIRIFLVFSLSSPLLLADSSVGRVLICFLGSSPTRHSDSSRFIDSLVN